MTKTIQEAADELKAACDRADAVAEAVRATFSSMSATDQKHVQAAVRRARHKIEREAERKPPKEQS